MNGLDITTEIAYMRLHLIWKDVEQKKKIVNHRERMNLLTSLQNKYIKNNIVRLTKLE